MRNRERLRLITACAVASMAAGGLAMAHGAAPVTAAGRKAMDKAAQANIAEIEEGRLALTHSRDPLVQALGNRLVQDHTKAQGTLAALAATLHVKLPTKPGAKQQRAIAQLGSLEGARFDRLFAASEVGAHRESITLLSHAEMQVKNPALEAWVKQSVPVLQEHLQLAQNLPSQVAMTRAAQSAGAVPRR